MINKLINDFDEGLLELMAADNIYSEYNNLIIDIEQSVEINKLRERQKELQFLILNLEQMDKKNFIDHYIEELNAVDQELVINKLLIKQSKLKMMIDLDQQIIKNELEKLKME